MRDCPLPKEHYELEFSKIGATSTLDNSETDENASKSFPEDFIFDGNKKLSEFVGWFASLVRL